MIEDLDDEILDFYEKHCAEPGGVVLAHFYHDDGSVIFSPHVIDVPEYSNVPDKELN